MLITPSEMGVGNVLVSTTENKGHDPDFWATQQQTELLALAGTVILQLQNKRMSLRGLLERRSCFTSKRRFVVTGLLLPLNLKTKAMLIWRT